MNDSHYELLIALTANLKTVITTVESSLSLTARVADATGYQKTGRELRELVGRLESASLDLEDAWRLFAAEEPYDSGYTE